MNVGRLWIGTRYSGRVKGSYGELGVEGGGYVSYIPNLTL